MAEQIEEEAEKYNRPEDRMKMLHCQFCQDGKPVAHVNGLPKAGEIALLWPEFDPQQVLDKVSRQCPHCKNLIQHSDTEHHVRVCPERLVMNPTGPPMQIGFHMQIVQASHTNYKTTHVECHASPTEFEKYPVIDDANIEVPSENIPNLLQQLPAYNSHWVGMLPAGVVTELPVHILHRTCLFCPSDSPQLDYLLFSYGSGTSCTYFALLMLRKAAHDEGLYGPCLYWTVLQLSQGESPKFFLGVKFANVKKETEDFLQEANMDRTFRQSPSNFHAKSMASLNYINLADPYTKKIESEHLRAKQIEKITLKLNPNTMNN